MNDIAPTAAIPQLKALHTMRDSRGQVLAIVAGDWAMDPDEVVRRAIRQVMPTCNHLEIAPRVRRALEHAHISCELASLRRSQP